MPTHSIVLRAAAVAAVCIGTAFTLGCATTAELHKVKRMVIDLERKGGGGDASRGRLADLGAQVIALQRTTDGLSGRLEVMERQIEIALEEARAAREEAYRSGGAASAPSAGSGAGEPEADVSEEVQRYRDAYAKWREGDGAACVDQFGKFLQTYPASEYADDATYWLGDCYFKQGNFSAAVLRFDDVARQFPEGNKAPDALYRQGEALLRMGHGTAAGNAFEKVLRDYPGSARAPEAKRQLDLLQAG